MVIQWLKRAGVGWARTEVGKGPMQPLFEGKKKLAVVFVWSVLGLWWKWGPQYMGLNIIALWYTLGDVKKMRYPLSVDRPRPLQ